LSLENDFVCYASVVGFVGGSVDRKAAFQRSIQPVRNYVSGHRGDFDIGYRGVPATFTGGDPIVDYGHVGPLAPPLKRSFRDRVYGRPYATFPAVNWFIDLLIWGTVLAFFFACLFVLIRFGG
jgi:hypothetical protein